jgi:ubiquinone/menaquinone biosynthesis C-methylase UbiE
MTDKAVEWYDKVHGELLLQAKPEFYEYIANLSEGLYLDISCGLALTLRYCEGVGCDFSKKPISLTRRMGNQGLFIVCDAQHLPFKPETFDTISCLGSLEHYPEPILAIREVQRILRKDGKYLVSVTNSNRWTVLFRFLSRGFRQPVEKHLNVSETIELLNNSQLTVTKIVKVHQFDFRAYSSLPDSIGLFLNVIDKILPITSNIEPLYICKKKAK